MKKLFLLFCLCHGLLAQAQQRYELNTGWLCRNLKEVPADGRQLSAPGFALAEWLPATVPGTVLTTLLNNKLVPDPFYGMNNERIPDIYRTGNEQYTYWFVKDFAEKATGAEQVYLQLRGINYKAEIYLNGKKVTAAPHVGMHLRAQYNITRLLAPGGRNRLAVLVYPPDVVGNPNGGQGGDGTIARGLTTQYTAGWDWIQPMRDRNTGIWDKVTIEKTRGVNIQNPHVVTLVPGRRLPDGPQAPATIKVMVEVENPSSQAVRGVLQYQLGGKTVQLPVTAPAGRTLEVKLPDLRLDNPRLWWPNGYGPQHLYDLRLQFVRAGQVLDQERVQVGVRQLDNGWNADTKSLGAFVNGQRVFIKGGNWIISDAMLRFSEARYDAEVRFHRDMNLNLIRVWGGALVERPEFYAACDKYGLLVFQDFWFSGDCNGRWLDPQKKDDQWTRRQYPDDHALALAALADQIKLVRNHASLAYWCGGNEITPPEDILTPLRDQLLPRLDGTRQLIEFSNSDQMSYNALGGNGDGPYGIQDPKSFWATRTYPYNSEVGSVGVGDYASLERLLPPPNLAQLPPAQGKPDSVWDYHKYLPYENFLAPYGKPQTTKDFAMKAQLVNYDQYRALMEGFSAHMWEWYTGAIIWKTQNPWTALRGQMYDCYLDPNACLYGLRKGSEPLHIMLNPLDSMVCVVNNGFTTRNNLMVQAKVYDLDGKEYPSGQVFSFLAPSSVRRLFPIKGALARVGKKEGAFVSLRILSDKQEILSENFYWLPAKNGTYSGLQRLKQALVTVRAARQAPGIIAVTLQNEQASPVAFFSRVALVDKKTGQRLLPTFYSDNYVSILPGETKTVTADYAGAAEDVAVEVYGWNVVSQRVEVR